MNRVHRLEDLRRDWQAGNELALCKFADRLSAVSNAPCPKAGPERSGESTSPAVNQRIREHAEKELVPACIGFLCERQAWRQDGKDERCRDELKAALSQLPQWQTPADNAQVDASPLVRAFTAGAGAIVGMTAVVPLSLHLAVQRELGLVVGGVLGAVGISFVIEFLRCSPLIRQAALAVSASATAGTGFAALWSFWRSGGKGLFWALLGSLAVFLVIAFNRPKRRSEPSAEHRVAVREQLELHLRHVADLVLAWCWAHPDRLPRTVPPPEPRPDLPPRSAEALGGLHAELSIAGQTNGNLRELLEELFQRLEEEGYRWKTIDSGTPFDESMREAFDTYGIIQAGEPVRTRKAALQRLDRVARKGLLRRI